jgi:hypothetical protein
MTYEKNNTIERDYLASNQFTIDLNNEADSTILYVNTFTADCARIGIVFFRKRLKRGFKSG